jgi:hypothetical protein
MLPANIQQLLQDLSLVASETGEKEKINEENTTEQGAKNESWLQWARRYIYGQR